MKLNNTVKRLNLLDRIVLQKEERKEISIDTYGKGCVFCGEVENLNEYRGKSVCIDCIEKINADSMIHNN